MIKQLHISGLHLEVGEDLKKYVERKIGKLDRFVPKRDHNGMYAEVKLISSKAKNKSDRTCEIILHLPHEKLTVKETTINMYAAVDIAETKLRHQLKRYKELHASPRLHQRLMSRLKHNPA
jgi:putative sigma-54 modulation protein